MSVVAVVGGLVWEVALPLLKLRRFFSKWDVLGRFGMRFGFDCIACIALIVVLGFTLWSLFSQRTVRNDACLIAYQRYYGGLILPSFNAGDGRREPRESSRKSSVHAENGGQGRIDGIECVGMMMG